MINDQIKKLEEWLDKEKIKTFLISFLIGFVSHVLFLTGNIANQDGLWMGFNYSKPGDWEITLGRWGILLIDRINNFIMIPSVVTILNVILLSIIVVFICDFFDFKYKLNKILTSLFIILSPCVFITFGYLHTSMAYCFALLISTLSIWFLYKFGNKKIGFVLSIICFMLSLSIYQSYIGVTIGMCVMYNILSFFNKDKKYKEVLIDIGKCILIVILGALLYYLITNIILNCLELELASYDNANKVNIINMILNLRTTIYYAYIRFFDFFIHDNLFYNTNYRREVLWIIFGFISIIGYICKIIKLFKESELSKKDKALRIISIIVLTLVIPISLNVINIIIGFDNIYAVTAVQIILFVPFILSLFENIFDGKKLYYLLVIISSMILITFFIAGNTSYEVMKLTYNQGIMTAERIISRIENIEGYNKDMPVVFAGIIDQENFPRVSSLYDYSLGFGVNNAAFHGDYLGQLNTWQKFLEMFFGVRYPIVSEEWYKIIVNSEEFKKMNIFPYEDSVKILEGAIVIKLKESPAIP